ncbi:M90 family metallopeptidase [Chitinivorax sp. B]|uniref:M90 family metallopeptidase n=1 Tax=Chitinivorax sp. B TaxID=2502235 RepID=UPI0010F83783|nr:M90 family metallopeptidase [Chitinivorax sp. B]
MWERIRQYRRNKIINESVLPESLWQSVLMRPLFTGLQPDERQHLKERVIWFLHEKAVFGVGDYQLSDHQKLTIAAQACLPIMNLDIDSYHDWKTVVVYPTAFVTRDPVPDAIGLVHEDAQVLAGQARHDGPVLLSWPDSRAAPELDGRNVVIHEFAHKLDMRNGRANGFPPLHKGMSESAWTRHWKCAYLDFCGRLNTDDAPAIDDYAATNPAEFFAVLTEVFFETPDVIADTYPAVYDQLQQFYKQNTLARLPRQLPPQWATGH